MFLGHAKIRKMFSLSEQHWSFVTIFSGNVTMLSRILATVVACAQLCKNIAQSVLNWVVLFTLGFVNDFTFTKLLGIS